MVMKKSGLIVVVILSVVASLANAGLVFTVDDVALPDGSTIVLGPCDVIELDLELAEGHNILRYDLSYTLTNSGAELITTGGYGYGPISFPTAFDIPGRTYIKEPQYVEIIASNFDFPVPWPAVLMENLLVHQLDGTLVDLLITVAGGTYVDDEWIPDGTILYTLHIVPEPATMALVGLGGLFLRSHRTKR